MTLAFRPGECPGWRVCAIEVIPYVAYVFDGKIVHVGEPTTENAEARERLQEWIAKAGDPAEFELLCWNAVAGLFGLDVRAGAFSYWSAPGPLPGVREILASIKEDLERGYEATGAYSLDAAEHPAPAPDVRISFGVEPEEYVVSATHPGINYILFVASGPEVDPPGVTRSDNANANPGVKRIPKHPPPGIGG